jgi:hypothetical protein
MMSPPREVIIETLVEAERQCVLLLRTDWAFVNSGCFREQIAHACRVLRPDGPGAQVPYSMIGRLFGVSKGTVLYHLRNWKVQGVMPGTPGRMCVLTAAQLTDAVEFAKMAYYARRPLRSQKHSEQTHCGCC